MKRHFYYLILLFALSCNNERVIQLPEIENAKISEVLDVSPAYLFYDESQSDSTLLNRKNLISTTNWLINVDKRLSLIQAIPHIKFLQDKKRNAQMHKNENAKNYFTCKDTSLWNLGFMEFTDTYYMNYDRASKSIEVSCFMIIESLNDISFSTSLDPNTTLSSDNIEQSLETIIRECGKDEKNFLVLNPNLSFQNYFSLKNVLRPLQNRISNNEFIY